MQQSHDDHVDSGDPALLPLLKNLMQQFLYDYEDYSEWFVVGILLSFLFFPIGIPICCYLKERKCVMCCRCII
jgi:hypothetical protein